MTAKNHVVARGQSTLQLGISVVLPGVEDVEDGCITRLQQRLSTQNGIAQVHIEERDGKPVLCLHYDPNLMPLARLERMARDEGTEITSRYRHETLPIKGIGQGTNVAHIEDGVRRVNGVLDVVVNYAAEIMRVEYDSTQTSLDAIIKTVRAMGYRVPDVPPIPPVTSVPPAPSVIADEHAGHDHDHEGHEAHGDHAGHSYSAAPAGAVSTPAEDHSGHAHDDEGHEAHSEGGGHAGHSHGPVDPNANWFQRNIEVSMSLLSGVMVALAYVGERFFGFSAPLVIGLCAIAYVSGGYDLARHTVPSTLRGKFDVEFLMLAAAAGAAFLGEWIEGAFLLFLFSFGHAMEHFAMERARDAIGALGKLTPKIARVRRGGQEIEVPTEQLQIGDVAIVRPGDRIAVDGKITVGRSAVDQSPITGESVPVEKAVGEGVFAGSINGDGALEVEVTKLAKDTTMSRVIKMVEESQTQKSPTQSFTDKFERVFVPVILVVVILAAIVPPLAGWLTWKVAVLRALSTLVAASPCALALATPAAVLAGIGQAARNGVLIKGGVHLENLGALNAIALDKTGTITLGKPEVSDIVPLGMSENELLAIAAAVETRSSHPLAQAVVRKAQQMKLMLPDSGELKNIQGRGVESTVGNQVVRIGNVKMFEEANIALPDDLQARLQVLGDSGKPTMIVGIGDRVAGILALADTLRKETPAALKQLRDMGVANIIMLTGDNARVAKTIAQTAGVTDVRADLLPENKVTAIQELLQKHGQVAMVGDGVNDAPALANATVGIAMGAGGTDVALETADVALMGDDLSKLPFAVALSRQSRAIIKQNLWISLGVIALLVPSTLFGLAGIGWAVIFHEGSTLVVVANALRLLSFKLIDANKATLKQSTFFIAGMCCPSEEQLIRNRLKSIAEIERLDFNTMQREVTVLHRLDDDKSLLAALDSLGLGAQRKTESPDESSASDAAHEHSPAASGATKILLGVSGAAALGAELVAWSSGQEKSWPVIALALISIAAGGRDTLRKGIVALKTLTPNINFLMMLAVVGAVVIGQWPEAAMVTFLFGVAEMIEGYSLDRARNAIKSLMAMTPETAEVQTASGGWQETPAAKVLVGQIVRVRPGGRVPLDGVLTSGGSSVNQAPITGESMPVEKKIDDTVFAGTVNERGVFEFRVTAKASNTTLARIIKTVQEAQSQRAPTQRFIDNFARYYTPAVVVLAVLVAAIPPLIFHQPFEGWLYKSLVMLVIACPCALVISTPVTVVSGLAAAAKHGILVKGGVYLEAGRRLKAIALDKTGTLTHGKPIVTDVVPLSTVENGRTLSANELLQLAASLDAPSEHPVASAIVAKWTGEASAAPGASALIQLGAPRSGALLFVSGFESLTGRGVTGTVGGTKYFVGNHRLAEENGVCGPHVEEVLNRLEAEGKTTVVLTTDKAALAVLGVADTLRETSIEAVRELHALGVKSVMLTGDNAATARAIAARVGIDDARGDLLPEDKLRAMDELLKQHGAVGMVGDGINDAPALAKATVGFAMGAAGTDTAIETADVALMKDDLRKLPLYLRLSRQTSRVLAQNITLAIGIKVVFFALALTGHATLWMAVFADMGASLLVVFNGLRLLQFKE